MVLNDKYNKKILFHWQETLNKHIIILTNIVHQKCLHEELSLQINYNESIAVANVVNSF